MHQSEMEVLITAITATAEVMGTELKPASLMLMADDLSDYPLDDVLTALKRCRRESSARLTLAAIIERVESSDGMPGAEEAWALMSRPEGDTVIITEQMGEAMQVAGPLLKDGDRIAARMAFKDAYTRIIAEAREKKIKPKWFVSLGTDKQGRAQPLADAIRSGKIALDNSIRLLGPDEKVDVLQLTGNNDHPFLLAYNAVKLEEEKPLDTQTGMKRIAEIKNMFASRGR